MTGRPSALSRIPLWQQRKSLRVQLTLLLTSLLLVACAAVGVASTVALHDYLQHRFEQQLALAAARYTSAMTDTDHDADNVGTATVGQAVGTLIAELSGGTLTEVEVISPPSDPIRVSAAERQVIMRLRPSARSTVVQLPALGEYRMLASQQDGGGVLVIGLPQRSLDQAVHHTVLAEVVVFVVVIATMTGLGAYAVRRSLRPLERVAATARRVSELPLGSGDVRLAERVPGVDRHTEVGQVSVALNHMLERVEGALLERQRDEARLRQFVADASHELRTPLSVVRSHSELLQRIRPDLPEEVRHSLRRIDAETGRMSSLVDDLLLLARLDAGQPLEHQPVDLSLLAMDAVADAQVAGPGHHWQLELPAEPVLLLGDAHRLHQVIANLLGNARQHAPEGTTVTVRLAADTPEAGTVRLAVHDTGPGIPAGLLPTVTDRFVRGDGARTRNIASSGLGLSIVAGVVAASGGSLTIDSRPGSTTVSVLLPGGPVPARSEPAPAG